MNYEEQEWQRKFFKYNSAMNVPHSLESDEPFSYSTPQSPRYASRSLESCYLSNNLDII